jgi:hypothetical protein
LTSNYSTQCGLHPARASARDTAWLKGTIGDEANRREFSREISAIFDSAEAKQRSEVLEDAIEQLIGAVRSEFDAPHMSQPRDVLRPHHADRAPTVSTAVAARSQDTS